MILVTGGAGYIGSNMVKALIMEGFTVGVLDNFSTGHRKAVHKNASLFEVDLLDLSAVDSVLSEIKPTAVLHFAAKSLVGDSMKNPLNTFHHNLNGANNLLTAMMKNKVNKLVFSSTAAVYGEPQKTPIEENDTGIPTNPYGESKLFIEKILERVGGTGKLNYVSLRYFNAAGADLEGEFGEDHRPETHLIPLVLDAAAGIRDKIVVFGTDYPTPDGTPIRDYIHIEDLVSAHILALKALLENSDRQSVYNLGHQKGYSVLEIIAAAREITGRDIPVEYGPRREGDPTTLIASSAKINRELGWETRCSDLNTIISSAWKWRQKFPKGYE